MRNPEDPIAMFSGSHVSGACLLTENCACWEAVVMTGGNDVTWFPGHVTELHVPGYHAAPPFVLVTP